MHRKIKYIVFFLTFLSIVSCSTKRNTAITRFYHNLTSKYNILFNGNESYKKGILRLVETYDDDFSQMLPVFLYTDKNALSSISPEMDRAIKKATKVVSIHSLTVKPKIKPDKELTQKQKEFYNRKEYNRYVDDAYLLMGKAHFYKMEYGRAKETFNYIVSNYPEDKTVHEAKIWLARLSSEELRYREADDILSSLSKDLEFPKYLQGELDASWADYFIKREKYGESVEHLKNAIDHTRGKRLRIRYTYLLAQVYAEIGDLSSATSYYGKVIRMNPPYTMTFSAKINQALTYQKGSGFRKDIEKQLRRMLRDDKNIEYQDQIYYALGNLFFKDNLKDKAIENYRLSIENSTDNYRQKAKTNLTLANLFYDQPNYIFAEAYYDSAVSVIDSDYPNYQEIHAKSLSLNKLVQNIRTVEFEDSVLKLSALPEPELIAFVDRLIEVERIAELERRRLELELAQERIDNLAMQSTINRTNEGGKWYFYNPTAKNLGRKEFFQVWGNRKLEDHWRRKNKSTIDFGIPEESEEDEDVPKKDETGRETNNKTRDFYLQNIPFTDSAKSASIESVKNGLYNMGEIYCDELKDYPEATDAYERLLKRFPRFHNRLHVYYKLHTIAKNSKDIERVSKYQQMIISEFPNSNFAKLMTNPNYIQEIMAEEKKLSAEYNNVRNLFESGRFAQVIPRARKLMNEHPDHDLFPKIDYMFTISTGLRKDTLQFIGDLRLLIGKYPSTDIADNAQVMIKYLEESSPGVVQQQTLQIARELYIDTRNETHFFMFVVPVAINFNQLIFNIVNFNLDNYDRNRLEVKRIGIEGKKSLCVVQKFSNSDEAAVYLRSIRDDQTIFRDVSNKGTVPVIISRTNYNKLKETNSIDEYILFFKENYK